MGAYGRILIPKTMKIVIDNAIPFLENRLPEDLDKIILPGAAITSRDVADADALLVRTRTRCDAALLKGSNVKFVGTATIGLDHFNIPELQALGITAVNAPGCNAPAVAQYVWSCLLRLGFRPGLHRLGLVGKGNIGSVVAEWGRRLGVEIMVCDPPRAEAGLTDEDYRPLEQLMRDCDAVTLHVPKTSSGKHPTLGLVDAAAIGELQPGAILINAARGGIVDEEALIEAIAGKGIRAVVDTWHGEPTISRRLLSAATIATPHIAGYSLEGKERATRMVLESLSATLGIATDTSGLAPAHRVPEVLTPEKITESYDPYVDMKLLLDSPEEFEALRDGYALRKECC